MTTTKTTLCALCNHRRVQSPSHSLCSPCQRRVEEHNARVFARRRDMQATAVQGGYPTK
jgi:hypothetical protein